MLISSFNLLLEKGYTVMKLKTWSVVTIGATIATFAASAVTAKPMPADQFHWSSAVDNGSLLYNGKKYTFTSEKAGQAFTFANNCMSKDKDMPVRVRGFLNSLGKEDWSKAEVLCGRLSVGGDTPIAYNPGGEIKVFGPIYLTQKNNVLAACKPYSNSGSRVWSSCGMIVPNDRTSMVFVGDGKNAGKVMETANLGSGIETVKPILNPEVEAMREKIFRDRVASGYYKN
jgi:hypothetical protein